MASPFIALVSLPRALMISRTQAGYTVPPVPGTATMKVRSTSLSKAGKLSGFLRIWGLISFETLKKIITFCVIDGLAILEVLCKHESGFQISL